MKEVYGVNGKKPFSFDRLHEYDFGGNDRKFTAESRYRYTVLSDDLGHKFFSKRLAGLDEAKDNKWSQYLEREAVWAAFSTAVGESYPELDFTGLAPLYIEERETGGVERLVYPFIDAPFLAEPRDSTPLHDSRVLSRYIKTLKALDTAAENWQPPLGLNNDDEHTPFDHVDKSWNEWIEVGDLFEKKHLSPKMVQQARQLVSDYKPFTTARFQHGDFVPWHVFAEESGNWVSFDGEHASMQKPRFYDLAYSYSRLFTKSRDSGLAARMLGGFIVLGEQNQEFTRDEFYNAFIPVLMSRSMGMFLDAANDAPRGDDYTAEAKDLFSRCQTRDLRALLETSHSKLID